MVEDRVFKGIDPFYVGELVREGIEQDWPYIFKSGGPWATFDLTVRFAIITGLTDQDLKDIGVLRSLPR